MLLADSGASTNGEGPAGKMNFALASSSEEISADTATADPKASPDKASPETMKRHTFDMSQVERIRIRVWGYPDVGGDFAIDPDFSFSMPRVGRIDIGAMSPAELEQVLSQKLSALTRADVTVAIEVAQFRPYFIMGQVTAPGAIEWKPGLKVIQAISLARGITRGGAQEGMSGQVRTVSSRQTKTQLTFALAQLARLNAEREGASSVETTDRVKTLIKSVPESSRATLSSLVDRQNDMLSEQRDMLETQLIGLRREREAAQREFEAAEKQESAVLEQLKITRDQLVDIEGLKDKKLVSKSRYLSQKSDLLSSEVRYAEAHSLVERARVRLNNVEQQIVMVPQQRRAALNERIDALEREVAQLELASGMSLGGSSAANDQDVLKLQYHIARENSSGVRTIPATVFTEILPGDVLIVSEGQNTGAETMSSNNNGGSSATNASSIDSRASNPIDEAAATAQRMIENAAVVEVPTIFRRMTTSSAADNAGRY